MNIVPLLNNLFFWLKTISFSNSDEMYMVQIARCFTYRHILGKIKCPIVR